MKKKTIFLSLIAAASVFTLASCKKNEVTPEPPIGDKETINYTITFVSNCDLTIPNQTIAENGNVVDPNINREGYNLIGWYIDQAYTMEFNFSIPVTSNITLYAKWEKTAETPSDPEVTKYDINFDLDGGTGDIANYKVLENTTITAPDKTPTKEGYVFKGWVDSEGNDFDFTKKITANTTLKAKYNQVFTVSFVDGENTISTTTVENGSKVVAPETNPTKEGYNFVSWVDSEGNDFNFDSTITTNTTINAKFKLDYYSLIANSENNLYKNDFSDSEEEFELFDSWNNKGLYYVVTKNGTKSETNRLRLKIIS